MSSDARPVRLRTAMEGTGKGNRMRAGALTVAAAVAALVMAGVASPAQTPATELDVTAFNTSPGAVAETEADGYFPTSRPTAVVTILVPAGYDAQLNAAPGAKVGTVTLWTKGKDGNSASEMIGEIVGDDPGKHAADACAPGTHAAVWELSLLHNNAPMLVPVYVDPAASTFGDKTSYALKLCADPLNVAGLVLDHFALDFQSAFVNPAARGGYVWRMLVTPYGSTGVADPPQTVENQAVVGLPQRLTLVARRNAKRHTVTLSGTLFRQGTTLPADGIRVHVEAAYSSNGAAKPFAIVTTDNNGHFSIVKPLRRTTYFDAYVNSYYSQSCDPTIGLAPCVVETLSPPSYAYATVKV